MRPLKSISSRLLAAGIALSLVAGCKPADRAEPQSRPPAQHPAADDPNQDKLAAHDEQHQASPPATSARPSGRSDSASAVTAPPSIDELPDLKPPPRSLSSRIDVEGSMENTKRPVVPSYREVPITPEEQKVIGKERERPDDLLAFYKPQPKSERVSPLDRKAAIGIAGQGGGRVGVGVNPSRVETYGMAGRYTEANGPQRSVAGIDSRIPIRARVGPSFVVTIGWGLPRTRAEQKSYLEP